MWVGTATVALLRVAIILLVLFFLYPQLLLPHRPQWSRIDRLAAACMVGLTLMVVLAQVLIAIHLYEWLGVVLSLITLAVVVRLPRSGTAGLLDAVQRTLNQFIDFTDHFGDGGGGLRLLLARLGEPLRRLKHGMRLRERIGNEVTPVVVLAAVVVVAVVARLGDAMLHSAPAPSDYLEHLQWGKWLLMRDKGLFPDAVYPRGLNILLVVLSIFTQENLHVTFRVGGPLLNLLGVAGLWYFVRSVTGSRWAALISTALFATAPEWIPAQWARQSAPLPQEFAMGLLLPAAWWGYRYIRDSDRLDLFLASAAAFVVASTHWITMLFLGAAFLAVGLTTIGEVRWLRRTTTLALGTVGGTALGLATQWLAWLRGVPILSPEFALGDARGYFQPLGLFMLTLVVGLTVLAIYGSVQFGSVRLIPGLLIAWLAIHLLPLIGVQSPAIATRSWDFLAIALIVAVGGGYMAVERLMNRLGKQRWIAGVGVVLVATTWIVSPPRVLSMEPELTDELTTQVLRVTRELDPATWMAVGRSDLLALVLGIGQQIDGDRFTREMPVPAQGNSFHRAFAESALQPKGTKPQHVPEVLFFVETKPFLSAASEASDRRTSIRQQNEVLAQWVAQFEAANGPLERFYQSPTLTVYRIRRTQG